MAKTKTKPKQDVKTKKSTKPAQVVKQKGKRPKKSAGVGIQEFKKCPKCTSEVGFFVYLIPKKGNKPNSFDLRVSCSKCKQKFKIGLILQ